tara:strand:- start:507 stop:737 length:231 start_codon:yes stop_codon:yes gene_type:complete
MLNNVLTAGVPITERNTALVADLNKVLGYDSGITKTEITESELYRFLLSGDCQVCRNWQLYVCGMMAGTEAWRNVL